MARTAIAVQTGAAFGGKIQDVALTAGDATNDHQFVHPGGDVLLFVKNADAAPHDVVVKAVASPRTFGRATDITISTTNAKESVCVIPDKGFDQGAGVVHLDLTVATGMSLAVFKLTPTA